MTIQELEQAILEAIETMYKCKYVGLLKLTKLPVGYKLQLGWRHDDYPISIMSDSPTEEVFLKYIKEELRIRRLDKVKYFTGYKIYLGQLNTCPHDDTCKSCQNKK